VLVRLAALTGLGRAWTRAGPDGPSAAAVAGAEVTLVTDDAARRVTPACQGPGVRLRCADAQQIDAPDVPRGTDPDPAQPPWQRALRLRPGDLVVCAGGSGNVRPRATSCSAGVGRSSPPPARRESRTQIGRRRNPSWEESARPSRSVRVEDARWAVPRGGMLDGPVLLERTSGLAGIGDDARFSNVIGAARRAQAVCQRRDAQS
jgi:hypothetical protein